MLIQLGHIGDLVAIVVYIPDQRPERIRHFQTVVENVYLNIRRTVVRFGEERDAVKPFVAIDDSGDFRNQIVFRQTILNDLLLGIGQGA